MILLWPGLESESTVNATVHLKVQLHQNVYEYPKLWVHNFSLFTEDPGMIFKIGPVRSVLSVVTVLPHHSTLASLYCSSTTVSQSIPAHTLALSWLPDLLQRRILFSWEFLSSKNILCCSWIKFLWLVKHWFFYIVFCTMVCL